MKLVRILMPEDFEPRRRKKNNSIGSDPVKRVDVESRADFAHGKKERNEQPED